MGARETPRVARTGDRKAWLASFPVESLWVRSDYAKEIQTLGTLHDDVWTAQSMGRSDEQIRDWATFVLKDFAQ
jgi:hypothetical protein